MRRAPLLTVVCLFASMLTARGETLLKESFEKLPATDPKLTLVDGPRGNALKLTPGQSVELAVNKDVDLGKGLTLSAWMRFRRPEAGYQVDTVITWGDAVVLQVAGQPESSMVQLRAMVKTDKHTANTGSSYTVPTDTWVHVTLSHNPDGPTAGHLHTGRLKPVIRGGGVVTLSVAGLHEEPFGVFWSGFLAPGTIKNPAQTITLGSRLFDGAVDDLVVKNAPTPVAKSAATWLLAAPELKRPLGACTVRREALLDDTETGLPVAMHLAPTFENIGVYVLHDGLPEADLSRMIRYRPVGQADWTTATPPVFDAIDNQSRGSILGLQSGQAVEVEVLLCDTSKGDRVLGSIRGVVKTWSQDVPVGRVIELPETTDTPLVVTESGRPDAWIVYRPRAGSAATIDGAKQANQAVLLKDVSYVVLENLTVRGGTEHCINVVDSHHVRIRRCDIAGWGEKGTRKDGLKKGLWVDKTGRQINKQAGVFIGRGSHHVVVEGNFIHAPRGRANSWKYNHPMGPQGIINAMTRGSNVIRYNDIIGSEVHWWNDAIESISNGAAWGGPFRDTDIQGNLLAFANDDGTELDGGQVNVRFFGNRVENTFAGLSGAPNLRGPAYVYRNMFVHLGDERTISGIGFKMGTGFYPLVGVTFIWHNTVIAPPARALNGTNTSGRFVRTPFWKQRRSAAPIVSSNNLYGPGGFGYPPRPALTDAALMWRDMTAEGTPRSDVVQIIEPVRLSQSYLDPEAGDFRLPPDATGIDRGVVIPGVSNRFLGLGPDLGAIEGGPAASSHFPVRPWGMEVLPQRLSLKSRDIDKPVSATVRLIAPPSTGASWQAIPNSPWLACTPARGTTSDKPIDITVTLTPQGARRHRGAVTFRTDRGTCRTVLVDAALYRKDDVTLYLEAESVPREGTMQLKQDPRARGGACIVTTGDPRSGKLVFTFDIPKDGTYYLRGRVLVPGPARSTHDSFLVAIDDAEPATWTLNPYVTDTWYWCRMGLTRKNQVGAFHFKKGRHHLTLTTREDQAHIDVLVVTDQPHATPPPPAPEG